MRTSKAVFETLAARHGITPEEVRAAIEEAVAAGQADTDPRIRARWRGMGLSAKAEPEALVLLLAALAAVEQNR